MNPKQMNPEVKAKWIEALRSGEYDQGMGNLKVGAPDMAAYCCLGVLCDLAAKDGVIPPGKLHEDEPNNRSYYFQGEDEFLPDEVMTWANLDSNNGAFKRNLQIWAVDECLTDLNDNGTSFDALADIIDEHF